MMNEASTNFILCNGRIIDGLGNDAFEGNVLVEDGRIRRVDSASQTSEIPAGVQHIDVGGQTIMPGLIDAHCHISFDEPSSNDELFFHRREGLSAIIAARNVQKLIRAGVTGFMDPDSLYETSIDLRDAIEAPVPAAPQAIRLTPEALPDLPTSHGRTVLCCTTGLRAWRGAELLATRGFPDLALIAAKASG